MQIGVFGTGIVGQTLAAKLAELGHSVMVGTRNPDETLARTGADRMGNPPVSAWLAQHAGIQLGTFAQTAEHGELLINATSGEASLPALEAAGEERLAGKVLLDIANPLDFSQGMPPTLSVCNTDSLGEQIQRRFPQLKVVKTLNTLTAALMVNPQQLAGGDHSIFVCGDDTGAKQAATELLRSFGWRDIIDLGDISTARGTEMLLPIWLRLWGAVGTPMFSLKVVR